DQALDLHPRGYPGRFAADRLLRRPVSTLVRPPEHHLPLPPQRPRLGEGTRPNRLALLAVPGGWLTVLGLIACAEAMAGSVGAAHWQPGLTGLPWLVGLAVALGCLFPRGR